MVFATAISLFYLSQTFLFSSLIGMIYSTLFAIVLLSMDDQIHKLILKTCFNMYKSRWYKFKLLFICIGISVFLAVFYNFAVMSYSHKEIWMRSDCLQKRMPAYKLGLDYTFFDFSILSTFIGCVFGCSFAATKIDSFLSP